MPRRNSLQIYSAIEEELRGLIRQELTDDINRGYRDRDIIDFDDIPSEYIDSDDNVSEEYLQTERSNVIEMTDYISDQIDENYEDLLVELGGGYQDYSDVINTIRARLGRTYSDSELARGFREYREGGFTGFDDFIEEHLPEGESSEASSRNVSGGSTDSSDPLPITAKEEKNAGPISDPTILDTIEEYNNAAESKANEEYAARFKSGTQFAHSSFMDRVIDQLESRRAAAENPVAAPKKRVFKVVRGDPILSRK
jgi:hypothetical protein